MTARSGMTTLIQEARRLANVGTADYTAGTVTYFSDDHLQDFLDRYRTQHRQLDLNAQPEYIDGAYTYLDYPLPLAAEWVEQGTASGSGWAVRDSAGSAAPSYTVNYAARVITFAADTENLTYYLDVRTFDLNQAVADIWETKAGFAYDAVDWASDNHDIKAEQEYKHCLEMASKFRLKGGAVMGGIRMSRMVRVDENRIE